MPSHEARTRAVTCSLIGLLGMALYSATLFPGIGGVLNHGDSAKFQFLGFVPGVGHAPGNPLYLALLFAVQRVPLGTPALRANLASAACAALALWLVANATYRVAGRRAAVVSAGALAAGGLFWEFATEAEVYALSGTVVAFIVYALVRADSDRSSTWLAAACGGFMLGLANHLSLVFAAPALLVSVVGLVRKGVLPTRAGVLAVLGCAAAGALLYALLPLLHAHSVYSEYPARHGLRGFFDFVTGHRWQSRLGVTSLEKALTKRSLAVTKILLRQWILPLWMGIPLALSATLRVAPAATRFCLFACLAWLAFLFLYDVPDPDGLIVPIAVCAAPALGISAERSPRPVVAIAAIALALAPTAVYQLRQVRDRTGFEVLEDVAGDRRREPLDLPDIIARIPEGAHLTVPCNHYGCVQVSNYFRFADPRTRKRNIQLVGLRGSYRARWASSPPAIDPEDARSQVVCTIHSSERRLLESHGARMQVLEREAMRLHGRTWQRLPVYCSVPQTRQSLN